jgi:hypothetical protein
MQKEQQAPSLHGEDAGTFSEMKDGLGELVAASKPQGKRTGAATSMKTITRSMRRFSWRTGLRPMPKE